MTAPYAEFKDWLNKNAETLEKYTLEQKKDMAINAGMDRIAVEQWYSAERYRILQ